MMNEALRELEAAIRALPRTEKPEHWKAVNYVGAGESALEYLDITAPTVSARLRLGFSFGGVAPCAATATRTEKNASWKLWDFVWKNSSAFEVMNAALTFADSHSVEELVARSRLLVAWVKRSDNWAHSDGLSSLYARILEADPKGFLPQIEKWSRSKNPWERRQSVVSLLYYARQRKTKPPLKTLLRYIERQLQDEHYYVQKGVGWAIREAYNVYPREMLEWIRTHAAEIDPAAWVATTEKLSAAERAKLKVERTKLKAKRRPRISRL